MASRRVLKAAEAIREVVSIAILADLKDPRISDVTVTQVEVAGDMRAAKVHVSVMGNETKQQLCLRGLQNSAGFLQKKISNRIDTRYTPRLEFVLDDGVKKSIEIARILREVLPEGAAGAGALAAGSLEMLAAQPHRTVVAAELPEDDPFDDEDDEFEDEDEDFDDEFDDDDDDDEGSESEDE